MFDYQINLDRAYAIRAEMVTFIDSDRARQIVPATAVIDEIVTRHPDVPRDCAEHLAERIFKHWGMPGLDYEEAPRIPGSDFMRAWYPIRRDGQLQRLAPDELTDAEIDDVTAGLRQQAEAAHAQAAQMAALLS